MEGALRLSLFVIQLSRLLFTFRERGGRNEWCSEVTNYFAPPAASYFAGALIKWEQKIEGGERITDYFLIYVITAIKKKGGTNETCVSAKCFELYTP